MKKKAPVDELMSLMLKDIERIGLLEAALVTIYRNECSPQARRLIESLAEKKEGGWMYNEIEMAREDLNI